jgi:hypothetical protein
VEENAMAQSIQAYNAHHRQLAAELTLCANYPVGQMQQQLAGLQQSADRIRAE